MVKILDRQKEVLGSGILAVVVVTLFLSGPSGDGKLTYSRPDYATCDLASCYIDYNVSNGYPTSITISTDGITALDTKGMISSPKALKEEITTITKDTFSDIEKTFKCNYTIKATSLSANATKTCIQTADKKEVVLFNQSYKSYDDRTQTFTYDSYEKTGEKLVDIVAYIEDTDVIEPNDWRIYRISFNVPRGSSGKFNTTLCFEIDGEQVCDVDDPYWEAGNSIFRRALSDMDETTIIYPLNGTGSVYLYNGSAIVYGQNCSANAAYIYYNHSNANAGVYNSTPSQCAWFSTYPVKITPPTTLTNLVAYYPLDEASGTKIYDYSSNGYNGNVLRTTTVNTAAKIWKGYDFERSAEDYSALNTSTAIDNQVMSMCAWIKPESVGISQFVYSKGTGTGYQRNSFFVESTNQAEVWWGTSASTAAYTWTPVAKALSAGNWYHICFSRNTTVARIYLNGALENSTTYSGYYTSDTATATLGNFKQSTTGTDYNFDGIIDDVQIWDRVLTTDEISALYALGTTVGSEETNALVLDWDWDIDQTSAYLTELNITVSSSAAYDACILEINGTTNVTMLEYNDTYAYYNYTPSPGNHTYIAYCNDSLGTFYTTSSAWHSIVNYSVVITPNDYGVTEPEFFPDSWTDTDVVPLSQVDLNTSDRAYGKTATADNFNTSHIPSTVVDNNVATYWKANYSTYTSNTEASTSSVTCNDKWDATQTCALTYDGNYGTYGESIESATPAYAIYNYTKPTNATTGAQIYLKDHEDDVTLDIPAECYQASDTWMAIKVITLDYGVNEYLNWSCYSKGGYVSLRDVSGYYRIYDHRIIWTRIYSYGKVAYWQVDLGSNIANIDYMKYRAYGSEDACIFFNVTYSTDGSTWTKPIWGWGQRCDNSTYITLNPKSYFTARYFRLNFENQPTSSVDYLTTYLGNLAEFQVYNGGHGIYTWVSSDTMNLQMKVNQTHANVTFKASDDWLTANAIDLTTSYQTIATGTGGYIWVWADFAGEVPSTYDWTFQFEAG